MKFKSIAMAAAILRLPAWAPVGQPCRPSANAKQFMPLLVYRTGQFAPMGIPWPWQAGLPETGECQRRVNGVKITFEECETAYDTGKGVRSATST